MFYNEIKLRNAFYCMLFLFCKWQLLLRYIETKSVGLRWTAAETAWGDRILDSGWCSDVSVHRRVSRAHIKCLGCPSYLLVLCLVHILSMLTSADVSLYTELIRLWTLKGEIIPLSGIRSLLAISTAHLSRQTSSILLCPSQWCHQESKPSCNERHPTRFLFITNITFCSI